MIRGWLGQSFFIESEVALSLKRVPNCALDNPDIVREAIYRQQSRIGVNEANFGYADCERHVSRRRTTWWVYVSAIVFALTLLFNARQEACGPANSGWIASLPSMKVAGVTPGGPMDKAGLRAGDVLEAAAGQPLTAMPDWFVARAHFERDRPIDLQIQRDGQHLRLYLMITDPSFRSWNKAQRESVLALYLTRLILLLLAMLVAFSRCQPQLSARLAALMLSVGAVAEGYPSSGWAAALQRLPAVLAIPICLASVSCVLAPIVSIGFCASFSRVRLSQGWQRLVVLVPTVLFGLPLVASSVAMIYAPSLMARPWPTLLSLAPVRLIQDTAGVTPLLFLSVWPFYRPTMHAWLLQLWLAMVVLYLAAGCIILLLGYYRAESLQERRRAGALCTVSILFGMIILHNFFVRNWTGWFDSAPPALFSPVSFVAEAVLLVPVLLTLTYCVLSQCGFNEPT